MTGKLHWTDVIDPWPMGGLSDIEAVTEIGTYTISIDQPAAGGLCCLWLAGNDSDEHDSEHRSSRDAEAAAEADYNARRDHSDSTR